MFKKIYIEITNVCNLACPFCIGNKRKKEFISKGQFELLLSKLQDYTKYLYFHVMGEPLLHPLVNELIDMASKRYFVNITTNGYLIEKIKDNKNIRQLNISLHSYDVKYGDTLEEYLERIFDSVEKLVSNNTYVRYRLWIDSKDKERIIRALEEKYNCTIMDNKKLKIADNIFYEVEQEFIWPSMDNDYNNSIGSCLGCRSHIGILVDGTIVPCCLDSAGIINLGNIYKQDLSDIINGDEFLEMKKGFLENKKVHPLCKKCNFYNLRR